MGIVAACVSGLDTSRDGLSASRASPCSATPTQAMSAVDLFDADVVAVSSHPDLEVSACAGSSWALEEREVDLIVAPGHRRGRRAAAVDPPGGRPAAAARRASRDVRRPGAGSRRSSTASLVRAHLPRAAGARCDRARCPAGLAGPGAVPPDPGRAHGARSSRCSSSAPCVVDAEARLAELPACHDAGNAVLFKMTERPPGHPGRPVPAAVLARRAAAADQRAARRDVARRAASAAAARGRAATSRTRVRRLRVQPGITGLWQVSGRSDLSWDESLRLDLWYVDNWSLVLDLQILCAHGQAVLRGQGPTDERPRRDLDDHRLATQAGHRGRRGPAGPARDGAAGRPGRAARRGRPALARASWSSSWRPCARGDAVLSEEGADDPARLCADRVWIVDPLDGTREFGEAGRDDWAVHVALWDARRARRAGAVALPGRGARRCGTDEPLRCSSRRRPRARSGSR